MIMDQSADSSGSVSDRSSNISCSPPPPKSSVTPPSIGSQHSPGLGSGRIPQSPMGHQLSPPHVSTPNSLVSQRLAHAGIPPLPPSLGLLNSLTNMVHHSPLDLMSVSHHHAPPRSYNSPPPISTSDPTANECKLVDYRGQKVAAFIIAGDTMLCLPQAFELFLKHLVGGLHTVYTKLKRLDIVPLVCNVEQVRILRGLGAIQPGVNRCKLLSCRDFDVLYKDCTTARCMLSHKSTDGNALLFRSSRPGRPPKRASSVGLSLAASHLSQLKKHRENGDYVSGYENGHLDVTDSSRLEKSPLLANGYNQPPTHHLNHMQQFLQYNHHTAAASLLSHPTLPGVAHHGMPRPSHDPSALLKGQTLPPVTMDVLARTGIWENCRAAYEDIVKHLERLREDRDEAGRALSLENKPRDLSSRNGSSTGGHSPVLNLSKNGGDHSGSEIDHTAVEEQEDEADSVETDNEDDDDKDLSDAAEAGASSAAGSDSPAVNYTGNSSGNPIGNPNVMSSSAQDMALSSTETLLRNIQGLLKVAADNARQQERQITYEKAELKMDIIREREMKEGLERQMAKEQKMRALYEKRYRKERKVRRHIQDKLESETKRRAQLEELIKSFCANTTNPEAMRLLTATEHVSPIEKDVKKEPKEKDRESSNERSDSSGYSNPVPLPTAHVNPSAESAIPAVQATEKPWNYAGMELINSGAAFWQNYSETLAQELELERKSRQHQQPSHHDRSDAKSPLQDTRSSSYYKSSVLFSTAT